MGLLPIVIVLIVVLITTISPIIAATNNSQLLGKESYRVLPVILFIVIILVIGIGLRIIYYKNEKNAEIYSKKVKIYDRKRVRSDDNTYYYIRVCDEANHVLMKWFPVSKKYYENGNTGTIYIIKDNQKYEVLFNEDNEV